MRDLLHLQKQEHVIDTLDESFVMNQKGSCTLVSLMVTQSDGNRCIGWGRSLGKLLVQGMNVIEVLHIIIEYIAIID